MSTERRSEPVELVWEAPRASRDRVVDLYDDVLEQVKQNPGRWARLRVVTQSNGYSTKRRLEATLAQSDERWEFKNARIEGDQYGLYARYRTPEQLAEVKRKR